MTPTRRPGVPLPVLLWLAAALLVALVIGFLMWQAAWK